MQYSKKLSRNNQVDFDGIIPIPLSPEKKSRGEVNRTLLLARELAQLLSAPVLEALELKAPFSKKQAIAAGATARQFELQYYNNLNLATQSIPSRVLVVDDVCTRGSTLQVALRKLREANSNCEIVAATAGQMIVKNVVKDESIFLQSPAS